MFEVRDSPQENVLEHTWIGRWKTLDGTSWILSAADSTTRFIIHLYKIWYPEKLLDRNLPTISKNQEFRLRLFRLLDQRNWLQLNKELCKHPEQSCFVMHEEEYSVAGRRYLIDEMLMSKYQTPNYIIWSAISADPAGLTKRSTENFLPLHQACYVGNFDHIKILTQAYPAACRIFASGHGFPIMCYLSRNHDQYQSAATVEFLLSYYKGSNKTFFNPILIRAYRNWTLYKRRMIDDSLQENLNERWKIIETILRKKYERHKHCDGKDFSILSVALSEELCQGELDFFDLPFEELVRRDELLQKEGPFDQSLAILNQLIEIDLRRAEGAGYVDQRITRFEKDRTSRISLLLSLHPSLLDFQGKDWIHLKSPLSLAIELGRSPQLIKILVEQNDEQLIVRDRKTRLFPFMTAASIGSYDLDVIYWLLRYKPICCLFNGHLGELHIHESASLPI